MKFIKGWLYVLIPLLLVAVSGCQSTPESETEVDAASAEDGATTTIALAPNPYLANRTEVPDEAQQRFARAQQALATGDQTIAAAELGWLTENHPNLSGPWLSLALLQQQMDQAEQAEAAYQRAIQANASNVEAFNQYGIFLREQGRFDAAEAIYLRGLEVWPDHAPSQLNLGILYDLYMGRAQDALSRYQRYQEIVPEPDRQIAGWVVDLQRRLGVEPVKPPPAVDVVADEAVVDQVDPQESAADLSEPPAEE